MNILLIGNGFDLAHGLPTKYGDFLAFCKRVFPIYENAEGRGIHLYQQEYLFDWDYNTEIKEKLKVAYESRKEIIENTNSSQMHTQFPILDEIYETIKDNIWIEYFFQCNMYQKENWIDFESEISNVIKSLDSDMHNCGIESKIQGISNSFLNEKYYDSQAKVTYKIIRDKLLNDLNKLIRALEIYLTEYVEKIDIKIISPDIEQIARKKSNHMDGNYGYIISNVLCFNYTNIYERIYINALGNHIDYIHGKADISNTVETNDMVLGIDEYLSKKRKNKEIEFISFKKYYQRIYKGTGCKYKEWIGKIILENNTYKENIHRNELDYERNRGMGNEGYQTKTNLKQLKEKPPKHNLYIFGHSLDITDKDVLRDLILNENVYTTIYYPDKEELGRKITNLVKVIGQDELIRRTGGSTKTIEFKLQQPMKEREDK